MGKTTTDATVAATGPGLTWSNVTLGVIALPLWLDNKLDGATGEQAAWVLWVVIIIAVIPWRYVVSHYLMAPGEPWRRNR